MSLPVQAESIESETIMSTNNFEKLLEPYYVDDIDTPDFDYLKKPLVTKKYYLEPLENKHFLDLFEFRLQNEPLESDPFDKLGEKFENAYTQFFNYVCNLDNISWVLLDRMYVVGFFLLEIEVDYNNYMNRNAHLYYEMWNNIKDADTHAECIKAIRDFLFNNSDIPRLELHLDDNEDDQICKQALESLGFTKDPQKNPDIGFRYYIINNNPIINEPPRHIPFILKAYQDVRENTPDDASPA